VCTDIFFLADTFFLGGIESSADIEATKFSRTAIRFAIVSKSDFRTKPNLSAAASNYASIFSLSASPLSLTQLFTALPTSAAVFSPLESESAALRKEEKRSETMT
jgi:hypothetical protein